MKELNPSDISLRFTSTNNQGQITKDVYVNCGSGSVWAELENTAVGLINDFAAPVLTADTEYDILLSLGKCGHTLLLVGENFDPENELLQKLELSGMFTIQYQLRPLDCVRYNRVKGSFLAGTQSQGPRDKWGKVK